MGDQRDSVVSEASHQFELNDSTADMLDDLTLNCIYLNVLSRAMHKIDPIAARVNSHLALIAHNGVFAIEALVKVQEVQEEVDKAQGKKDKKSETESVYKTGGKLAHAFTGAESASARFTLEYTVQATGKTILAEKTSTALKAAQEIIEFLPNDQRAIALEALRGYRFNAVLGESKESKLKCMRKKLFAIRKKAEKRAKHYYKAGFDLVYDVHFGRDQLLKSDLNLEVLWVQVEDMMEAIKALRQEAIAFGAKAFKRDDAYYKNMKAFLALEKVKKLEPCANGMVKTMGHRIAELVPAEELMKFQEAVGDGKQDEA